MTDEEILAGFVSLKQTMVEGFEAVDRRLDARIGALETRMLRRFDEVDARFDGIDRRLDGIDVRLDGIDVRLDGIDHRLDKLTGRVSALERPAP